MTETPTEALPRVASTVGEFAAWIEGFGDADALADWLHRHGIVGTRLDPARCPLAKIAESCLGQPVEVGAKIMTHTDGVPLPSVGREFIVRFDGSRYPELIDREAPGRPRCGCVLCTSPVSLFVPPSYVPPTAPYTPNLPSLSAAFLTSKESVIA